MMWNIWSLPVGQLVAVVTTVAVAVVLAGTEPQL
jgi:hypothetical protein